MLAACGRGGRTVEQSHPMVEFIGILQAGHSPEGFDCAWLVSASGDRLEVFYPDGWNVLFRPVRVLDATGRVIAQDGDLIRVAGPGDAIGESACTENVPLPATSVENLGRPSGSPTRS